MARKGPEGFENFYSTIYGDRWPALRAALLAPVRQVARQNRFVEASEPSRDLERFAGFPAIRLEPEERFETKTDSRGLLNYYLMDPASISAAAALEVQPGDRVLDLCAAPGGKSLILAEALANKGNLTCNEMSDRRRARLRAVLEDYLPSELRARVQVTGHDGAKWCLYETEAYDRVLLDAPCSGERHLLLDAEELKLWSPARSKNLAVRQYALLASAHAVVRAGGRIVYSTCSLSPLENDQVIARLLKKRQGEVAVRSPQMAPGIHAEKTEHGWMILPDKTGFGPIYFSVMEKLVST